MGAFDSPAHAETAPDAETGPDADDQQFLPTALGRVNELVLAQVNIQYSHDNQFSGLAGAGGPDAGVAVGAAASSSSAFPYPSHQDHPDTQEPDQDAAQSLQHDMFLSAVEEIVISLLLTAVAGEKAILLLASHGNASTVARLVALVAHAAFALPALCFRADSSTTPDAFVTSMFVTSIRRRIASLDSSSLSLHAHNHNTPASPLESHLGSLSSPLHHSSASWHRSRDVSFASSRSQLLSSLAFPASASASAGPLAAPTSNAATGTATTSPTAFLASDDRFSPSTHSFPSSSDRFILSDLTPGTQHPPGGLAGSLSNTGTPTPPFAQSHHHRFPAATTASSTSSAHHHPANPHSHSASSPLPSSLTQPISNSHPHPQLHPPRAKKFPSARDGLAAPGAPGEDRDRDRSVWDRDRDRKLASVVVVEWDGVVDKAVQGCIIETLVRNRAATPDGVSHNLPKPFCLVVVAATPDGDDRDKDMGGGSGAGLVMGMADQLFLSNDMSHLTVPEFSVRHTPTGAGGVGSSVGTGSLGVGLGGGLGLGLGLGSTQAQAGDEPVVGAQHLAHLRQQHTLLVSTMHHTVDAYIADILVGIRNKPLVVIGPWAGAGGKVRAGAGALAALFGAPFVTPTHVDTVADKTLSHRMVVATTRMVGDAREARGAREVVRDVVEE
ncbi:hypothetical protein HDU93_002700, partial [Gonapodya sp. JEL0774]